MKFCEMFKCTWNQQLYCCACKMALGLHRSSIIFANGLFNLMHFSFASINLCFNALFLFKCSIILQFITSGYVGKNGIPGTHVRDSLVLVHRFNNNDIQINWISLSQSDHWIAIKRRKNADHQLMESNMSTHEIELTGAQHCLYILPKNLIKIPFMHIIESGHDFFLQITIAEMHYHTNIHTHPKWDRHIRMTKMNCH